MAVIFASGDDMNFENSIIKTGSESSNLKISVTDSFLSSIKNFAEALSSSKGYVKKQIFT